MCLDEDQYLRFFAKIAEKASGNKEKVADVFLRSETPYLGITKNSQVDRILGYLNQTENIIRTEHPGNCYIKIWVNQEFIDSYGVGDDAI